MSRKCLTYHALDMARAGLCHAANAVHGHRSRPIPSNPLRRRRRCCHRWFLSMAFVDRTLSACLQRARAPRFPTIFIADDLPSSTVLNQLPPRDVGTY